MDKQTRDEINEILKFIENNGRHMEDCATLVAKLIDSEVDEVAAEVQSQTGWDFSDNFDIFEKRTKLKIALFAGYIPVL
jgi:hypothetical protein